MESAEKGGRMSSPHVDEEKREKLRYIKGKRKRKRGSEAGKRKRYGKTLFWYLEPPYTKTQYFGLGSD